MSNFQNYVAMTLADTPGTGNATLLAALASPDRSFFDAYGAVSTTVNVEWFSDAAGTTRLGFERNVVYNGGSPGTLTRGTPETPGALVSLPAGASVRVTAGGSDINNFTRALRAVTPGGRLTLESNVPISSTDQSAKTSIWYTPLVHDVIDLWDGADWVPTTFVNTEETLGTLTASREHSVYAFLNAGGLDLEKAEWPVANVTFTNGTDLVNWTSTPAVDGDMIVFVDGGSAVMPSGLALNTTYFVRDKATNSLKLASTVGGAAIDFTTNGSGTITAKVFNVTWQDGRLCKNGDKTRLLLGGFYTSSTTATMDTAQRRFVCNLYNQVTRRMFASVAGETTTSATIGEIDGAGADTFPRLGVMALLATSSPFGATFAGSSSVSLDIARFQFIQNGSTGTNQFTYDIECSLSAQRVVGAGNPAMIPGFNYFSGWFARISGSGTVTAATTQFWGSYLC